MWGEQGTFLLYLPDPPSVLFCLEQARFRPQVDQGDRTENTEMRQCRAVVTT